MHRRRVIRDALPARATEGIQLHCRLPYTPEWNDIERIFRTVKHTAMPVRTLTEVPDLIVAVKAGFATVRHCLLSEYSSMMDA